MEDNVLSKEPWPAKGIEHYSTVESGHWGYLVLYETKGFVFDASESPSREEIMERWGSRFK